MKALLLVLVLLPTTALAEIDLIAKAQDAVRQQLRDPDSARFEQLKVSGAPDNHGVYQRVVCGLVNAKNATGGYAGRTPFVYFVDLDRVNVTTNREIVDGFTRSFSEGSRRRYCEPQ